jgi:hypothetical protein
MKKVIEYLIVEPNEDEETDLLRCYKYLSVMKY